MKKNIITIIGPRSVGKSIVSENLAKLLGYKHVNFDHYMNAKLKKQGGIGGFIEKHAKKSGDHFLAWKEYYKALPKHLENFFKTVKGGIILDLGGATVASHEISEAKKNANLVKKYSEKIILLLPAKDPNKSIKILFPREKKRDHFKDWDSKKLLKKVKDDYYPIVANMKKLADKVVYRYGKTPKGTAKEIKLILKK